MSQTEKDASLTPEEYTKQLDKLRLALSGVPSLLRHLERNLPLEKASKIPMGLMSEAFVDPGKATEIRLKPITSIQPYAMVLEDETARRFNVLEFRIANVTNMAAFDPIPLDTCAVRYFADAKEPAKLLDVQDWGGGIVATPGTRLRILVANTSQEPWQFRGILWSRSLYLHT
jgi:hypothetical protein